MQQCFKRHKIILPTLKDYIALSKQHYLPTLKIQKATQDRANDQGLDSMTQTQKEKKISESWND